MHCQSLGRAMLIHVLNAMPAAIFSLIATQPLALGTSEVSKGRTPSATLFDEEVFRPGWAVEAKSGQDKSCREGTEEKPCSSPDCKRIHDPDIPCGFSAETLPHLRAMLRFMEPLQALCEQTLRAQLVACRLAKSGLAAEITSATTSRDQRREAMIRYADVVSAMRQVALKLEMYERVR